MEISVTRRLEDDMGVSFASIIVLRRFANTTSQMSSIANLIGFLLPVVKGR
jgi:hypothetical protein